MPLSMRIPQLFVASMLAGTVKAFAEAAEPKWASQIKGHISVIANTDSGRSFALASPPSRYNSLARAVLLNPDTLLLQYATLGGGPRTWGDIGPLLSFLLRTRDGRECGRTSSLPLVLTTDKATFLAFDPAVRALVRGTFRLAATANGH